MQLPPDHARVRMVTRRLWIAWLIGAMALLAWGAWLRFALPQAPVIDRDVEGYLGPSVSALSGHHFVHMIGRSFPYPAFVYGILRVSGDFRAIAVIQHLMGVAAGLLILLAWNAAGRMVPVGGVPKPVYPFLGFAPAFTYLVSRRMILFEHQIRPEAIFSFLGILTLWVSFLFLEARFVRPRKSAAFWFGALNVFLACLLYEMKPSFGFAALFCTLPVWISLIAPGVAPNRLALLAAAILPAFVLLVLPERSLKKSDGLAVVFLPETLFTIHAPIIEKQMEEDLAGGGPLPYPRQFLQSAHDLLRTELATASRMTTPRPFASLGTNPDYLMYEHSFCWKLVNVYHLTRPQVAAFCFTYYRRALLHHPVWMISKVLRQLLLVYQLKCPIYWTGHITELSNDHYAHVAELIQHTASVGPGLPIVTRYVDECVRLGKEKIVMTQSNAFDLWLRVLGGLYLLTFIVALASPFLLFRSAEMRAHFFWFIAALWLAFGFNFGNCLTIAIVHTLEVTRYVHVQLLFAVFAEWLTFYFLLELAALRFRARLGATAPPHSAPEHATD